MIYEICFSSKIRGFEKATCYFESNVLDADEVSSYVFATICDANIPYDAELSFDTIGVVNECSNHHTVQKFLKALKKRCRYIKVSRRRDIAKLTGHPIHWLLVPLKK